ncbi:MAG: hypothetical protein ACFFBP_07580 [Promethearchaeota archaeon]
MGLKFEPKLVKEAEDYYKTLHMGLDQKYIIIAIGKLISKFLPIPERAIRGFIWRTIREWQLTEKKDLSELSNLAPSNRINEVVKIIKLFETQIKRVLMDEQQGPLLEETMKKVLEVYIEKFANR